MADLKHTPRVFVEVAGHAIRAVRSTLNRKRHPSPMECAAMIRNGELIATLTESEARWQVFHISRVIGAFKEASGGYMDTATGEVFGNVEDAATAVAERVLCKKHYTSPAVP